MLRTIVELYDKEPVENVLAACAFQPERVVYVCDKRDSSLRKEMAVTRLFKSRGLATQARFYYVDVLNLAQINRTFAAIKKDYPDCAFDFSGGTDLVLAAAGTFCRDSHVPAFYIDIRGGSLVDIYGCTHLAALYRTPVFSAADIFALQDAAILGNGHFGVQQLDDTFKDTVYAIWDMMLQNVEAWASFVGWLQAAGRKTPETQLAVTADKYIRVNAQSTSRTNEALLYKLQTLGVLQNVQVTHGAVSFSYATPMLKASLTNHGIWLELFGYYVARDTGLFDGVYTSVVVDWNADKTGAARNGYTTRNEIDLLLIKGITPVFISCKMGVPSPLALGEIKILSEKFGGARTRTVLMSGANIKESDIAITQRAKDLDITVIDRSDLTQERLALWFKRIAAEK